MRRELLIVVPSAYINFVNESNFAIPVILEPGNGEEAVDYFYMI